MTFFFLRKIINYVAIIRGVQCSPGRPISATNRRKGLFYRYKSDPINAPSPLRIVVSASEHSKISIPLMS